jgi:hypothetical protein
MSGASAKAPGEPRRAKRPRRRSGRSQNTLEIIEGLLERRISISVNGEPKQSSALQAIMFQLLQRASAGKGRAMRTYQDYDEFAARRSSSSTELQFDDDLDDRAAESRVKEGP